MQMKKGLYFMKKIKVLFFLFEMGGGGAARTLLNIMNNLDRDKFLPILVTLYKNNSYEAELRSDIKFIKLKTRLRSAVIPISKIIKEEEVDVVFSTIPVINVAAVIASFLSFRKVKNVIREADNVGGSFFANIKLRFFGLFYKLADRVVSLSEGVKENLIKRYGVKESEIQVIYNPVDVEGIHDKMRHGVIDERDQSIFDTPDKVIITAGRLVVQKDQRTLLRAFAKVSNQMNCRLVILGEGPLKEELISYSTELGVGDKVYFVGFKNNPYIYFKKADLFVLSSKHEGFGHVIAEALATGTPVVATNCKSGPAEVLEDGKLGLLCGVGDDQEMSAQMLEVLSLDDEQLSKKVALGLQRVEDFDAKKIVKQYESLICKIIGKE